MPALVIVAGISVLGFGYATPEPGSPRWFAAAPLWFAAATTVLIGLLRVFGRFGRQPALGAPAPMARLVTPAVLGAAGLLGLVPFVLLVLTGVLLAARPSAVPVRDFRG